LDNLEYLKYLSSIISNNGRYTREINFSIAMTKAAFRSKQLFSSANLPHFLEGTSILLHSYQVVCMLLNIVQFRKQIN